jgi:hypothetical protein
MRSIVIVVVEPLVKIILKLLDRSVELLVKGFPEELIQNSPVETL